MENFENRIYLGSRDENESIIYNRTENIINQNIIQSIYRAEENNISPIILPSLISNLSPLYEPRQEFNSIISSIILSPYERRSVELEAPRNSDQLLLRALELDRYTSRYELNEVELNPREQPRGYSMFGEYDSESRGRILGTQAEQPLDIQGLLTSVGAQRPDFTAWTDANRTLNDFARALQPQPATGRRFELPTSSTTMRGANGTTFTPSFSLGEVTYEEVSIPSNTPYLRVDFTPHGRLHRDTLRAAGYTTTETMLGGVQDLMGITASPDFELYASQNTPVVGITNPVMANFAVRKLGFRYVKDYTDDRTGTRTIYTTAGNLQAMRARLQQVEARLRQRRERVLSA